MTIAIFTNFTAEMTEKLTFREIQFLGYNLYGFIRRSFVMLFCFAYYLYSDGSSSMAEVFFYLGLVVLVFSASAFFIPHMETKVTDNFLVIRGPAVFRKIEMPLNDIKSVEIRPYSPYRLNRPIFNLHKLGERYFYAYGRMCVRFEKTDGSFVTLGTQHPVDLKKALTGK